MPIDWREKLSLDVKIKLYTCCPLICKIAYQLYMIYLCDFCSNLKAQILRTTKAKFSRCIQDAHSRVPSICYHMFIFDKIFHLFVMHGCLWCGQPQYFL